MHDQATTSLPPVERYRRWLAATPPAESGKGGHDATFAAACAGVRQFGLDPQTVFDLMAAGYNPRCVPPWSPTELAHKVQGAAAAAGQADSVTAPRGYASGGGRAGASPNWPAPDAALIAQVTAAGPGARELIARSPYGWEDPDWYTDGGANCAAVVEALFVDDTDPDPWLCVGKGSSVFATRRWSTWLQTGRLREFALIVPAHMTARTGLTKEGRESQHTLDNTGPRRFVVVEFDSGTENDHAARLTHLAGYAPLVLVVHSGGKSLHGWFPVGGSTEEETVRFMRYAARLGADPALFRNRSQFVRLPAGTRDTGCRQSVFYWDPAALPRPAVNQGGVAR